MNGTTQTVMTYPGLGSGTYDVTREFDRLGRLTNIDYDDPMTTPNVTFTYNSSGNRSKMTETGSSSVIRETVYGYDAARRLTSVGFDHDGGGIVDETVAYSYDAGGLRTTLTMPGGLDVTYTYDTKGQLLSLTNWDDAKTTFAYDGIGRMRSTERPNGLRSQYQYDPAGRLTRLLHAAKRRTLADFAYTVDKRGNRTQARELLAHPGTGSTTLDKDSTAITYVRGTWTNGGSFKESSSLSAAMRIIISGDELTLTMGMGPDHSLYDIYIDHSYWDTLDGYAASAGDLAMPIQITDDGVHTLEIRSRAEQNFLSTGYKVRFKTLETNREYSLHTWDYEYDGLSRIRTANQHPNDQVTATALRAYTYSFDLAGNRLSEALMLNGGTPTVTSYTYNAANQISSSGFAYDLNGNMTDDGSNSYTWDRANRLLSMGGHSYAYDGEGRRVSQTVSSIVTQYLLDVQPGLVKVLAQTTGSATTRFVHDFRGILAQKDPTGDWLHPLDDGLHSVRSVVDDAGDVLEMTDYSPFGTPENPLTLTPFAFTGEMRAGTGLQDHRARQYNPALGVFQNIDPFEGTIDRPISLNGYSWVEGNVVNKLDPSGKITLYDKVAAESNFTSILIDGDADLYGGRTLVPNRARNRFMQLEAHARRQQRGRSPGDSCLDDEHIIDYVSLLATVVGGEMGLLSGSDFDIAAEAVGRWYYDYTQPTGSTGQLYNPQLLNPNEGFQDDELWIFLGNVESFYSEIQNSIEELYAFSSDPIYRNKAEEILNGRTNEQNITNGLNIGGRPVNWGNPGASAPPQAFARLRYAYDTGRLRTNTDAIGTYSEANDPATRYSYAVFAYYRETEQVIWSFSQEKCLSRPSSSNFDGNPINDVAPQNECRICRSDGACTNHF